MNFSSVRFFFVRFGTKLFVLFFGWPPQRALLSCPHPKQGATASPPLPRPAFIHSNLPTPIQAIPFSCHFVSFRFGFDLVWFCFALVCYGLVLVLCFIYVDYLMDFARCGFGIEFPVRSSGSGSSSNGYGHASKTFVNIVNVIGARTVLWM